MLVARDAGAALAELDRAITEGVDVGQLLDQLLGYFRDVMAAAVGCPADALYERVRRPIEPACRIGRQAARPGNDNGHRCKYWINRSRGSNIFRIHASLAELALVRICRVGRSRFAAANDLSIARWRHRRPDKSSGCCRFSAIDRGAVLHIDCCIQPAPKKNSAEPELTSLAASPVSQPAPTTIPRAHSVLNGNGHTNGYQHGAQQWIPPGPRSRRYDSIRCCPD